MNRLSRQISSMAVALLVLAAPLRAQTLAPVYDFALPAGHSYALGLETDASSLFLFTIDGYYKSPFDVGGSMTFTRATVDFPVDLNMRLAPESLVSFNPAEANHVLLTGGGGLSNLLYDFQRSPPAKTSISLGGFLVARPSGIAADDGGSVYLSSGTVGQGIFKLPDAHTSTPELNFGTSGAGALNTPSALAFGPDGLLYVLDTGDGRIVSFDTDGVFQGDFSLAGTASATGMAISPDGRLFLTKDAATFEDDVWQVADIYNLYTGDLLGHLTTPTDDTGIGVGKPSIAIEGNYLYWTSGSGENLYVYAVPEPATTALFLGTGTLALAFLRLRKRP